MSALRKPRLSSDIVGILEDRLADDPLDFSAYDDLIQHYRSKSKLDEARQTYELLLKVLPSSAFVWRQYAEMEAAENELGRVEALFNRALMASLHLDIWNYYLDYIRRTHPLATGGTSARTVISQAYEFVLQHVGIDLDSGPIWADYLAFLKVAPAASSWEEQQRNDQLRKTYQRAVVIPLNNVESLWREYNTFENGINKQTARKFLSEKSPAYMTARATAKEIKAIIDPLRSVKYPSRKAKSSSPHLYASGWRRWIELEKSDPLEFEDPTQLRNRIKYAYKQCLMYCRFYPEMWFEAAAFYETIAESEALQEATHTKPSVTLKEGLEANADSWLLTFAYAEIEESAQRHENVKKTFETLIAHNEIEINKVNQAAESEIALVKAAEADDKSSTKKLDVSSDSDSDESDREEEVQSIQVGSVAAKVKALEAQRDLQVKRLSEEGTVAAIMYMRALRRMEGIKAARQSFATSIRSPHISWQIYVASALMEHQFDDTKSVEKDGKTSVPIPIRIFTRGLKLFPENIDFILEYLNFLLGIKDDTNARALFEQTTAKVDFAKARPLYARWYEYESMYGDLTSAQKLASRIVEMDAKAKANSISMFGQRFSFLGCDPIARRDLGILQRPDTSLLPPPPPLPFNGNGQLPPHPLAFPPPIPGRDSLSTVPSGFNPPILPQYQRMASPLVVPAPAPPPLLHTSILNLIRLLPPAEALGNTITFDYKEFLQMIRNIDLSVLQSASSTPAIIEKSTPQAAVIPTVPAKRTAQSMIPTPDDVVALGRHNDPRDPYKKRA